MNVCIFFITTNPHIERNKSWMLHKTLEESKYNQKSRESPVTFCCTITNTKCRLANSFFLSSICHRHPYTSIKVCLPHSLLMVCIKIFPSIHLAVRMYCYLFNQSPTDAHWGSLQYLTQWLSHLWVGCTGWESASRLAVLFTVSSLSLAGPQPPFSFVR